MPQSGGEASEFGNVGRFARLKPRVKGLRLAFAYIALKILGELASPKKNRMVKQLISQLQVLWIQLTGCLRNNQTKRREAGNAAWPADPIHVILTGKEEDIGLRNLRWVVEAGCSRRCLTQRITCRRVPGYP